MHDVVVGREDGPLQRAVGHWPEIDLDRAARALQKGQQPKVLWFTGRPGAGKSTIANLVEKKLYCLGRHTCLLDGDSVDALVSRRFRVFLYVGHRGGANVRGLALVD